LRWKGEVVPLANLPFRVLVYLVEHRDRVVTREELIERFWDGKDVYDDTLRKAVGAIRKALGDSPTSPRFVETRHREGYRFVGPCEPVREIETPVALETTRAEEDLPSSDEEGAARPPARASWAISWRAAALLVVAAVTIAVLLAPVAYRPDAPEAAALPPAVATPRSIAVLPLENLSGDRREDYLGEGIAEGLIDDLTRVNGLRVISRRSAFAFKGTQTDAHEIGRRLGVDAILEGSVRREGRSVRVEVRLVSTDDGRVLWAGDAGGRSSGDLLEAQEALACSVASELRVTLCGEGERVSSRYTSNADAYREYLQGRYFYNRRSPEDLRRAIDRFEAALAIDPSYALAYAGLAETYAVMVANSVALPATVQPKGELAARRALELDDSLASAWAARGLLATNAFAWEEGDRAFERALALNPEYGPARHWYAHSLLVRGRFEEAEAEMRRAQRSDPLSYPIANGLSELYFVWGRYDEAIAEAIAAAELEPKQTNPYHTLALAYLALGRGDEALEAAARSGPEERHAVQLRLEGPRDEERRWIDRVARSPFGAVAPYSIACMYAKTGDGEQAFRWLERAYAMRQPDLAMIKISPDFASLRSDPRYADLVRRVGLS
jgi:TolB-like protein/DNA-binding winged helix-turn-helix (wHTH) protein